MDHSSSGRSTGRGRKNWSSSKVNNARFAPMPSASVNTATAVKPGFFSSWQKAKRRSCNNMCMAASDVIEFGHGTLVLNVTRVQSRGWLEEQNVNFLLGNGPMFDVARHHQEITLVQPHVPITEFHSETSFDHEEELVLSFVMV